MTTLRPSARTCVLVSVLLVVAAATLPLSASGQWGRCHTQSRRVTLQIAEQPYRGFTACGRLSVSAVFPVNSPDLPVGSYLIVGCPSIESVRRLTQGFVAVEVAPIDARQLRQLYSMDNYRSVMDRNLFLGCSSP